MLSVTTNTIMLNVVMLSVVMLNVVAPQNWAKQKNRLKATTFFSVFLTILTILIGSQKISYSFGLRYQVCRGLYYKTFYNSNCCRIVISQSICHFLSLSPWLNICWQDQEPTISAESSMGLYSGMIEPFCQKYQTSVEVIGSGKHSSLLQYDNNYCCKKFYSTGHRTGENVKFHFRKTRFCQK